MKMTKEERAEYWKKYYAANKNRILMKYELSRLKAGKTYKKYEKTYSNNHLNKEENIALRCEYQKQRFANNREKQYEYQKKWNDANRDRLKAYQKAYRKANRDKLNAWQRVYKKARYKKQEKTL